jgi:hypothetical protein
VPPVGGVIGFVGVIPPPVVSPVLAAPPSFFAVGVLF